MLEAILSLPEGAEIELRAPVFQIYGEELDVVYTEVRKKGCRWLVVDGATVDLSSDVPPDVASVRHIDAVVDRFVVSRRHEKAIRAGIAATLLVGDGLLGIQVLKGVNRAEIARFHQGLTSATVARRVDRGGPPSGKALRRSEGVIDLLAGSLNVHDVQDRSHASDLSGSGSRGCDDGSDRPGNRVLVDQWIEPRDEPLLSRGGPLGFSMPPWCGRWREESCARGLPCPAAPSITTVTLIFVP
jgi:hypothetical protein